MTTIVYGVASGKVTRCGGHGDDQPVRPGGGIGVAEERRPRREPAEVDQQQAGGDRDREHLEPELERLDVGDPPHPSEPDVDGDDEADGEHADEVGRAGDDVQSQARALELGDQVEPGDQEHRHRGERPHARAAQSRLGEVGDRVGPESAQGRGDEQEQGEVAGREAQRLPQRDRPVLHLESRDPEEARRRQVLAGDRGGVPPRRHRS